MALTATVTPKKLGTTSNVVSANLTVNDGAKDVIVQDFSVQYTSTHDEITKDIEPKILAQMQAVIDEYKAGLTLEGGAEYKALKVNLEAGLVL